MRRYALEPLEAHARVQVAERDPWDVNDVHIAAMLGTSRQSLRRWRRSGVTADQAESLCEAAGLFVYDVYPEILDEAVSELERVCEAEGCEVSFVPARPSAHRRFCSRPCRDRTWLAPQAEVEIVCASLSCQATFMGRPKVGARARLYCSPRCTSRETMRRYRATEAGIAATAEYRRIVKAGRRRRAALRSAGKFAGTGYKGRMTNETR